MLKRASIANLLEREDVSNGDVLRCLDTHRNIVLVGKVVDNGILIPGQTEKSVNLNQFEKIAAQSHSVECIVLPSGKTVEDCLGEINSERQKKRMGGNKLLIEDEHDDYCAYCGFGGNLLCCETCPVTTHAPCAGVCDSDSDKEWFCPGCRCAVCQNALHEDNSPSVCPRVYYGEADWGREASSCHEYNDILNTPNRKRLRIKIETEDHDKPEGTKARDEKVYLGTQLPDTFLKNFDVKGNGIDNDNDNKNDSMIVPWDVVKSACGTWAHAACVKGFVKLANAGKAWYNGKEEQVLEKLVSFCSKGAMHVGKYACGATISFQIIHPAAASSEEAQGVAPKYSDQHKESLRRILSSSLYILRDSYDELWDSRTGTDLISMMLKGESKRPWVDFSDAFVAVLYVDSTVASVCCFRLLGESMAEIPLLTSRQEIRGCKAGMALLSKLEQCLHVCGIQKVVMPAMYCPNHAYLPAFHPQGEPLPPPSQEKFGFAIAEANVVAKILSHRGVRLPGVPWVQKETNPLEWPEWREKCANTRIKLADSIDLDGLLERHHVHVIPSEEDTPDQDVLPLPKKKQRMNCLDIVMKTEDKLPDHLSLQTAQGNGDLKCVSCQ